MINPFDNPTTIDGISALHVASFKSNGETLHVFMVESGYTVVDNKGNPVPSAMAAISNED